MNDKKEDTDSNKEEKLQKASQLLQEEQAELIKKCTLEINEVLNKYSCTIDVAMLITSQGSLPQVSIIPKQQNPQ